MSGTEVGCEEHGCGEESGREEEVQKKADLSGSPAVPTKPRVIHVKEPKRGRVEDTCSGHFPPP